MSEDLDPSSCTSIYSDFELLIAKIMRLPGKEVRATLIKYMACRISAEIYNLEEIRDGQDCSKGVINALCESSGVLAVSNIGQSALKEECLGSPKTRCADAVRGCPISECEFTSSSAYLVKRHIDELHQSHMAVLTLKSTSVKPKMLVRKERRHECNLCGKTHRSEIALHVHVKAHLGDDEGGSTILRYTIECRNTVLMSQISAGA